MRSKNELEAILEAAKLLKQEKAALDIIEEYKAIVAKRSQLEQPATIPTSPQEEEIKAPLKSSPSLTEVHKESVAVKKEAPEVKIKKTSQKLSKLKQKTLLNPTEPHQSKAESPVAAALEKDPLKTNNYGFVTITLAMEFREENMPE